MRRSPLFPRIVLGAVLTYLAAVGATYEGILGAPLRTLTVLLFGIGTLAYLFVRRRKRDAHGYRTALDAAMLLWVIAFGASLLGNLESWRRIVMALWFMGIYIGAWYVIHDALANRIITRTMLVDGLLFAGFILVIFGYVQIQSWMRGVLPLILSGDAPFSLPRPVSTLGNPNTLAAVLVMLLPLVVGRVIVANNGLQRLMMTVYSAATLILLLLTYSRGGWLGGGLGLVLLLVWILADRDRLSPARLREWWIAQRAPLRVGVVVTTGVLVVALIGGGLFLLNSLNAAGRTLDLRTFIYDTALTMFAEKPITGHGLFTFGGGLARLNSTPPTQPHSHAHNVPLQVAAEMGVIGLAALAVTLWSIIRGVRANLVRSIPPQSSSAYEQVERVTIISAAAAFAGFCLHHLLDLPSMNPAVLLFGLVGLIAAAAPKVPQRISQSTGRIVAVLAAGVGAVLFVSGVWSSILYWQYTDAVSYGVRSGNYAEAAARLEPIVAADSEMAVYHQQRGFLLGLAAAEGDTASLSPAITEFERYTQLAPEYSTGWANLGALYAQSGDYDHAVDAMSQAVALAPLAPSLAIRLAAYQTAAETGQPPVEPAIELPISTALDDEYLPNINYIQWLRLAIPRQFLPQVHYGALEVENTES